MSEPFTRLQAVTALLDQSNIDTDAIIPARFMKTVRRSGLGKHLFDSWRFYPDGRAKPEFVLNHPASLTARILVVNDNFGCGSSREHAVWAMTDFGIRCVIGASFAEIFYNNAIKNGLLPVTLARQDLQDLIEILSACPGTELTVDLKAQRVSRPGDVGYTFDLDPTDKERLLLGLDDIAVTQAHEHNIRRYEIRQKELMPWLFKDI